MKILNFGSLNIDYVYAVEHFVRPGETILSKKRDVLAGGKGLNQSVALARALGKKNAIEVFHAGGIGKNDGVFLKELLSEIGANVDFVYEHDAATGHAIIQVDESGQNCILLFGGANQMQTHDFIGKVFTHFSSGDFLVLQNEINELSYIIEKAHEKAMTIFLNPSPYDEKINKLPLQYVDYFLLNEVECADVLGMATSESICADEMISALRKKFSNAKIVLTLGKNGVAYFDGSQVYRHGIYKVKVADTTAAGDTFTGFFVASLAQNISAQESLRLASVASSIAVSRKGAAPSIPTIDEVKSSNLEIAG